MPSDESSFEQGPERAIDILLAVVDAVNDADGVQPALERLAYLALKGTGADRCALFALDSREPAHLVPAAGATRFGDRMKLRKRFLSMPPVELTGGRTALLDMRRVVPLDDAASSKLLPEAWKREWRSKSVALAPLRAGGEVLGLLAVEYVTETHDFADAELRMIEAIANAAGSSLRSARLVEQLQRAVTVERRLVECTTALRSGGTLEEVLDVLADSFASLLPGVSCSINLLSPDRQSFTAVAHRGEPAIQTTVSLGDLPDDDVQLIQKIWEDDPLRPVVVADIGLRKAWRRVVPEQISAGMLVPLPVAREIIGFVSVGRERGPFTEEEVEVARVFADQAALAVEQGRMTEALQVRLRVIEALYRLSDAVVRTSDLRTLLVGLNQGVCADLQVRCLRASFRDHDLAKVLRGAKADDVDLSLMSGWGGASVNPVEREGDYAVPIRMGNKIAGVLWVRSESALDVIRLELLRAVASGIGEVASKARLRRTLERRSKELAVAAERERIARDLHDTVGQTFYGIGLKLQDLMYDIEDQQLLGRLSELRQLCAGGVANVRSAIYSLSFLHVRAKGFVPSLRALAQQFTRMTGVEAEFRVSGRLPNLSEDVVGALYRLAHEALVNVDRHARATGVVLSLSVGDETIQMAIRDDGVGLDQRQSANWQSAAHFGLRSTARSIEEVGGTFQVHAAQPRGLMIAASIPLPRARRRQA